MAVALERIDQGDCVTLMDRLPVGSIDLVFADPPFNIGYDYDEYDDRRTRDEYLSWSRQWMASVSRVLKTSGTFWLAIGDEYAAELKVLAQNELGFFMRSWIVWYYTFGVNCKYKFSRSHTHLFHFVKDPDPKNFTFNSDDPALRVPSARQLVYADKRANPKGRLPDDTWILRPQDLPAGFLPDHDTWYFARVAGTFKERAGFHGCQMPEQLLGRIIRVSSQPNDMVLDPFAGSGTTLAVAKKLGRKWLGFELSPEYVKRAQERLHGVHPSDPLDGAEDPVSSAPTTANGKRRAGAARRPASSGKRQPEESREVNSEFGPSNGRGTDTPPSGRTEAQRCKSVEPVPGSERPNLQQADADPTKRREEMEIDRAITEAYFAAHDGFSVDRFLADPELTSVFADRCQHLSIPGEQAGWSRRLLRLRKSGRLPKTGQCRRVTVSAGQMDRYVFASEIAWQILRGSHEDISLDDVLCDPNIGQQFDRLAEDLAPGFRPVDYRWAALHIRKRAHQIRRGANRLPEEFAPKALPRLNPVTKFPFGRHIKRSGVYLISSSSSDQCYFGETFDLSSRLIQHRAANSEVLQVKRVGIIPDIDNQLLRLSIRSILIGRFRPTLNLQTLGT